MQIAKLVTSVMKSKLCVNALLLISHGHRNVKICRKFERVQKYSIMNASHTHIHTHTKTEEKKGKESYALFWHNHAILH